MKKYLLIPLLLLFTFSAFSQTHSTPLTYRVQNTPTNSKDSVAYSYDGKIGNYSYLGNLELLRSLFKLKVDSISNSGYVTHGYFNAHSGGSSTTIYSGDGVIPSLRQVKLEGSAAELFIGDTSNTTGIDVRTNTARKIAVDISAQNDSTLAKSADIVLSDNYIGLTSNIIGGNIMQFVMGGGPAHNRMWVYDYQQRGLLSAGDYSTFQISNDSAYTSRKAVNLLIAANPSNFIGLSALSATSPIFYNNSTGVISSQAATGSVNGYLTAANFNIFNGKQNAITTGSTAQYIRGDLSLATFPSIPTATNYVSNQTGLQSSSNFNISGTGKFTSTNNATTIGGATSDINMSNVAGDTFNVHLDNSTDILSLNANTQLQFNAGQIAINGGFASNGDAIINGNNFLNVANAITPVVPIVTTGATYILNNISPDAQILVFTGSASQSVQLPSPIAGGSCGSCILIPNLGSGVGGQTYTIRNASSGTLTVVADDNSTVQIMAANTSLQVLYNGTAGYTNASWNIVYYTGSSSGVTAVTGTTSRVTSTGGATPQIDISATFEALLEKVSNKATTFGTLNNTLYPTTQAVANYVSASSPVTSVFGRTGAVVSAANDYTFAQIGSKPTSVSGYGITDALTPTNTNNVSNKTLLPANIHQTPTGTAGTDSLTVKIGATGKLGAVAASYYQIAGTYLTPSSTDTLTNKSGNISQWTNDSGYLTANQSITFTPTGDVTGSASGATSLTPALTIGAGKVTNAMLAGSITNANLLNSSTTINGTAISLGASGTVTAAAGTLTGSTLSSGVTSSSLTAFGSSPTLNTAVLTGLPTGSGVSNSATASTLAARDANGEIYGNGFTPNFVTVVSSATPYVLTSASPQVIEFTGSTPQTVTMPVASTLQTGWNRIITSSSSGAITIQTSGANTIATIQNGNTATLWCVLASGTGLASWDRTVGVGSLSGTSGGGVLSTGATMNTLTLTGTTNTAALSAGASTITAGVFANTKAGLGTTAQAGVSITNSTAATVGTQNQYGLDLTWTYSTWNTGGTPAANQQQFSIEPRGINGATTGGNIFFKYQNNGGGFTDAYSFNANGNLSLLTGRLFQSVGAGDATLSSGTVAVTVSGVTTSSRAQVTRTTASGSSLTTGITAVCTANTLTITADVAAGTINTADNSTYTYNIIN